jgi:hygromycin-B 7''-O-kinase
VIAGAEQRARRALQGAGLDPRARLVRARSEANEAWLGDGFALRVNFRGDLGRLRREAELARRVPPQVRYPAVLAHGDDGEIEWLVTQRVKGIELAQAWPRLDRRLRERATIELADALRALHRVDTRGLPGDGELLPPHVLPLDPLLALLDDVADRLDAGLVTELRAFVRDRWDAFDDRGTGLVHGDPHLENVLWDGEHLSAVLDLEWARPSWLECDTETLLSFCDHPARFVAAEREHEARPEDYAEVPGWLRGAYPELFEHPRLADRLVVLHVSRTLTIVEEATAPSPLREAQLRAVLDGTSFLYTAR